MKRELIITADGSSSIYLPEWNESYHSQNGAIREAYHVFMEMGLFYFASTHQPTQAINILEIGFGTGLNAFISFLEAEKKQFKINYTAVEAYPVSPAETGKLNYVQQLSAGKWEGVFREMHEISGEKFHAFPRGFRLKKERKLFQEISDTEKFDLLFFDAFGPEVQPELWTGEIFANMFQALKKHGVLVTYSAKGSVRRAMQTAGFCVERLPGPPGKRHMLRATK